MNKLVRGGCIALGAALFGASFYLYNNFINPPVINVLTDNKLHREFDDEGTGSVALVMAQGKLKMTAPLRDEAFGVVANYPILIRKVEMYQYFLKDGKAMIGWRDKKAYQKSIKDAKGKEWKNPLFPNSVAERTFTSDFTLGDNITPISGAFLNSITKDEKHKDDFYILAQLPASNIPAGYVWKKNHYFKASGTKDNVGSVRVYYTVFNHNKNPQPWTIVGQQRKGTISKTNADARFYEKIESLEEIKKTYKNDAPHAAAAAACFGAFFIILGIFKARS